MLIASSLIAAFGLVANSSAVIIGAMLVSPLMTPIFGISLGLVRGNSVLLGRSMRAELTGIALAVAVAALLGFLPLAIETTPEMLARTQPHLLDLLVAVLAGIAGTYAVIDERISPSLPGVAIATALAPPLVNAGLCLALGAYEGALGSFLLFLANLFSILLVASLMFIAAGMATRLKQDIFWNIVTHFGVTIVGFIIIAAVLTHSLVSIVKARTIRGAIKTTVTERFFQLHAVHFDRMIHTIEEGKLFVLVHARAPKIISPNEVFEIQKELSEKLRLPTELIIRTTIAKDVGASGSFGNVTAQDLDGEFLEGKVDPRELMVSVAEQVLIEEIDLLPGAQLLGIDMLGLPRGATIVATIQTPRILAPEEIGRIENEVRGRLRDKSIHLVVRFLDSVIADSRGKLLYGWGHYGEPSARDVEMMERIDMAVNEEFKRFPALFPVNIHYDFSGSQLRVLIEVVGIRILSQKELLSVKKNVSGLIDQEVDFNIWSRAETVVTEGGYIPFGHFNLQNSLDWERAVRETRH